MARIRVRNAPEAGHDLGIYTVTVLPTLIGFTSGLESRRPPGMTMAATIR
jgi:hypothetical protein